MNTALFCRQIGAHAAHRKLRPLIMSSIYRARRRVNAGVCGSGAVHMRSSAIDAKPAYTAFPVSDCAFLLKAGKMRLRRADSFKRPCIVISTYGVLFISIVCLRFAHGRFVNRRVCGYRIQPRDALIYTAHHQFTLYTTTQQCFFMQIPAGYPNVM